MCFPQCFEQKLILLSFFCLLPGCTDDIFTSDHSPVFATFDVGVVSPFRAKTGAVSTIPVTLVESLYYTHSRAVFLPGTDVSRSVERAWIELEGIEAIVKTASKAKFFIEFHSSCLEGRGKSVSVKSYIAAPQQKGLSFCRDAALE